MNHVTAYIALGSNLGDREAALQSAMSRLDAHREISVARLSSVIETEPVGPAGQGPYLNAVAEVRTTLSARALLEVCLAVEAAYGRDRRAAVRWGPRTLDLDLLLFGDQIIDEPGLRVPHPHLHQRLFVLEPLAEVAPSLLHPILDRTIQSLLVEQQAVS